MTSKLGAFLAIARKRHNGVLNRQDVTLAAEIAHTHGAGVEGRTEASKALRNDEFVDAATKTSFAREFGLAPSGGPSPSVYIDKVMLDLAKYVKNTWDAESIDLVLDIAAPDSDEVSEQLSEMFYEHKFKTPELKTEFRQALIDMGFPKTSLTGPQTFESFSKMSNESKIEYLTEARLFASPYRAESITGDQIPDAVFALANRVANEGPGPIIHYAGPQGEVFAFSVGGTTGPHTGTWYDRNGKLIGERPLRHHLMGDRDGQLTS